MKGSFPVILCMHDVTTELLQCHTGDELGSVTRKVVPSPNWEVTDTVPCRVSAASCRMYSCGGTTDALHLAGPKKLYLEKKRLSPACSLFMQLMHETASKQG